MNILDLFRPKRVAARGDGAKGAGIKKVAVLGSGVMGAGIAAHIANAGTPVLLLDIVPADAGADRSKLARGAIERLKKTDPAPLMHPARADLITPGNLEDDLGLLAGCDWIIEVVLEDIAIKRALYEKIETVRGRDAIVSSNTSTIQLDRLLEGRSEAFARHFLITHFFNPPRYMRLLEMVVGPRTSPTAAEKIGAYCDTALGKTVVRCHDTPGFIANRILTFWMQAAMNAALDDGVDIEVVDAVMSKPLGIPKTGVFGLIDMVGIDLVPHLSRSLLATLPPNDPYVAIHREIPLIGQMIAAGYTGRKGKGGFYRLDEKRRKQVLRLDAAAFDESAAYRPAREPRLESTRAAKGGLRAVVEHPDEGGRFAWKVLSQTLAYAATLVPAIADDVAAVDEAVRLGANWKWGPFEMLDALGPKYFADRLRADGAPVPPLLEAVGEGTFYRVEDGVLRFFGTDKVYRPLVRPQGVLLLADIKRARKPLAKKSSACLWDVGEGVLCLEFTGKMNALDEDVFALIQEACDRIEGGRGEYKGMVVYNEGSAFSAGANLGLALFAINLALWPKLDELIAAGQAAYTRLKYAPFPVVAAPSGIALGGGCEVLLASDHVQAHAETYCGLVETGVGLIPGWGGCKEMLARCHARRTAQGPMPFVRAAFETIALAKVAKSADDAKELGYFRDSDGITMNRDRLLFDARAKVLELARDYRPPLPVRLPLPGPSGKYMLDLAVADLRAAGKATAYDTVVCDALATVLTGGADADPAQAVDESAILDLERAQFIHLLRNEGTLARIGHMLDTGKPLRN